MEPVALADSDVSWPRAWPWAMLALFCFMLALAMLVTGVRFRLSEVTGLGIFIAASAVLARVRDRLGHTGLMRFSDFCECWALLCGISLAGAIASYAVGAMSSGYVDNGLAQLDAMIGFNWVAAYQVTASSPVIQLVGRYAYATIFLSPTVVLAALCANGRADRARRFVTAYGLALAVVVVLFAWLPAEGPISFYGVAESQYETATSSRHHVLVESLRAGGSRALEIGSLEGLVSVPSFHAATAVLLIWAALPMRRFRWLVAAVNIAMLMATPIEGNHYMVDIVAGIALAWLTVTLLNPRLTSWRPRSYALRLPTPLESRVSQVT